jgi:hypothetical protein
MAFCGNVPVNGADIISILVGAHIIEFKAGAFKDGVKIPLHLAINSLPDLYFVFTEFFQQLFHSGTF